MSTGTHESFEVSPNVRKRPIGVSILAIWDALFAGIVPLLLATLLFFDEETRQILIMNPTPYAVRVLLTTGVLVGAVLAWRGERRGRNLLVASVIAHHFLAILNNVGMALIDVPVRMSSTRMWLNAVRSAISIAIHVWYFLGKPTRDFYSEQEQ